MDRRFALRIIIFASILFLLGIIHGIAYNEFNFFILLSNVMTIFLMTIMIRKDSQKTTE
jgi:hypothetical protein